MTMQDQIAPIGYIKLPTVSFIQNTKKNYYFFRIQISIGFGFGLSGDDRVPGQLQVST